MGLQSLKLLIGLWGLKRVQITKVKLLILSMFLSSFIVNLME